MILKPSDIGGLFSAHRIIVTGGNGAGKSLFADTLSDARQIPLHRNDALVLLQDWRCRSHGDIENLRTHIAAQDAWVIEGGPSLLSHEPIKTRAMLVVWLDLPPLLRCWRILRRTWRYRGQTRPDLPDGNPENFDRRHWRFLRKAWQNHAKVRQTIQMADMPCPVLRLRNRAEVRAALSTLSQD